jgi:phosphocarrier protein HPr
MTVAKTVVQIRSGDGLNLLGACKLARTAGKFTARAMVGCNKNRVSAKSVMELITLEAEQGSKLTLWAEGDDATEAIAAIQALFNKRFDLE